MRSVITLSQINTVMMRLWGVRYLITDKTDAIGKELASLDGPDKKIIRLLELPNANIGQFSPTQSIVAQDFKSGLAHLHDNTFDGTRDFISDELFTMELTPAIEASLTYEKYGFKVFAQSPAQSVIVLPIQFSHCWTFAGTNDVKLFRANLMQLGVLFKGKLDGRLVFNFGPVWNSACRLTDLADMRTLRVSEGRARPPKSPD